MYTVKGNGIIWDKERNQPLARFVDGAFTTEDKNMAERLAALGYITEKAPKGKSANTKRKRVDNDD